MTEPAYLGRDLILNVGFADGETEVEAELEWALSRRLGLVVALPYIDGDESGIGDAGLGLRALLVEQPAFLFSTTVEMELPTGDADKGLGSDAVAIGWHVHTWTDLGNWTTLQTQLGLEFVPDTDDVEVVWSFAFAQSFCTCPLFGNAGKGGHEGHGPHAISVMAEVAGATALSGEAGDTEGQWLLGLSYPLFDLLDLRAAYTETFEGDDAWILGLIFHF